MNQKLAPSTQGIPTLGEPQDQHSPSVVDAGQGDALRPRSPSIPAGGMAFGLCRRSSFTGVSGMPNVRPIIPAGPACVRVGWGGRVGTPIWRCVTRSEAAEGARTIVQPLRRANPKFPAIEPRTPHPGIGGNAGLGIPLVRIHFSRVRSSPDNQLRLPKMALARRIRGPVLFTQGRSTVDRGFHNPFTAVRLCPLHPTSSFAARPGLETLGAPRTKTTVPSSAVNTKRGCLDGHASQLGGIFLSVRRRGCHPVVKRAKAAGPYGQHRAP